MRGIVVLIVVDSSSALYADSSSALYAQGNLDCEAAKGAGIEVASDRAKRNW